MEQINDSFCFDLERKHDSVSKQSIVTDHLDPLSVSQDEFDYKATETNSRLLPTEDSSVVDNRSPSVGNKKQLTWKRLDKKDLISKTVVELKKLHMELSMVIEDVFTELVRLLEERQKLQDEVDIRNIAIEQLWKVQEKLQWRLTEPQLGIQMSVIFPSDSDETIDCL